MRKHETRDSKPLRSEKKAPEMIPANHDLRAWMHEVESIKQLHRIQGVPWDKDMGGLVEMILV